MNIKQNAIKQKDGSLVYPLTTTLFDYFPGRGYKGWCRYRIVHGHAVHIAGAKYPSSLILSLKTTQGT